MFDILRRTNDATSSLEPGRFHRQKKFNTYMAIFTIAFIIILMFILFFSVQSYYSNSAGLSTNTNGQSTTNHSDSNVDKTNNLVAVPDDVYNGYVPMDDDDDDDDDDEDIKIEAPIKSKDFEKSKNKINESNHYKLLILITSQLRDFRQRNSLREILFGMENNLEPCTAYDRNIYYKFLIPPYKFGKRKKNSELYRNFVSEIIENNDIVEFQHLLGSDFTQETVLNWTKSQNDYNITFDHLVLINGTSLVNFETLQLHLSYKKQNVPDYSTKLPKVIWANFETKSADNIVVIGVDAINIILENKIYFHNSKHSNLITQAYFYTKENPLSLSNNLESLFFINDYEGFIVWSGKIDGIPQTTIGVGNLNMISDIVRVTEHLSIPYVPVCHFSTPPEDEPKIAVVTSSSFRDRFLDCNPSMLDISIDSVKNKRTYAQRHNYPFISLKTYGRGMQTWGNTDVIRRTLLYYDWVLWIDTDTIITNYNISIHELLDKFYLIITERMLKDNDNVDKYEKGKDLFNENIDIVVAKSVEGNDFNSGILLIRHSSWSFNFINNWQAVRTKRMVEQGSMWHLLDQFPDFKQRILILNHDDYPLSASLQTWKKDDFTLNYVSENCPAKFIKNSLKEIERN